MMSAQAQGINWPTERQAECPLCHGTHRHVLIRDVEDLNQHVVPGLWTYWLCESCGLAYLDPRLRKDVLPAAYADYVTHTAGPPAPLHSNSEPRFAARLRDGYLGRRYGYSPGFRYRNIGALMYLLPPPLRLEWHTYARHLNVVPDGQTLLDVGCGNGDYLKFASDCGWTATGLDFDPAAVALANSRGLHALQGTIEDLPSDSAYDVVTASHVLEHVADPLEFLTQLWHRVKPGGMLWLITPNWRGPGFRRHLRYWISLETPRHLTLFDRNSLHRAIQQTTGVFPQRQTRGWHLAYIDAQSKNLASHHRKFENWTKWLSWRRMPGWLTLETLGMISDHWSDELVAIARKPSPCI